MAKKNQVNEGSAALADGEPKSGGSGGESEVTPARRKALDRLRNRIERDLDRFISKAVEAKPSEFTDEEGWRYIVACGQDTRAAVKEVEGELFLRVESFVMPLPADRELILPLMREAMEYNDGMPGYARFGISERWLSAVVMLPASHILRDHIEDCLEDVGILAAIGADRFKKRYGGTTKKRALRAKTGKATRRG